jgi:hypothetical protein
MNGPIYVLTHILDSSMSKKCHLGPQNGPKVWDPKNHRKIAKMWNHSELVE